MNNSHNVQSRVSKLVASLASVLIFNNVAANELTAELGLEAQLFAKPPLHKEQTRHNASASLKLEYYHDWDDGNKRIAFTGFGRYDANDSERTHGDIRELYYWQAFDNYIEFYAGLRHVFWGVTETKHLVDVINQTDAVENIDGEDKLGQPMISVLMERDWGTLEGFALFGFRERNFAGLEGRLRSPLPINQDDALFQSSAEQEHVDWALRWSHVIGDWDIGLSHFSGTSRDPLFIPELNDSTGSVESLTPYYEQIEQTGLDVQATKGAMLWKLEAISVAHRNAGRNTALVGGFEYTLYGILDSDIDLGLLMEYQFDDRSGIRQTANQNDIALGMRYAFNDVAGTEVLAALSIDLDNQSRFYSIEASRRLNNDWSLAAEARIFSSMDAQDPAFALRNDDYLQIELRRFF